MASEILQIKPQVEYDMYQTSGATRVRFTSEDKKAQTMKALRSLTIAIAIPLSLTLFIIFKFGSPKRYRTIMAKPIWFPPLWLINLASIGSSFSMSLAAWFVWVNRGFHMNSDALPLYISQISLSIVWHPLQLINDSVWFESPILESLNKTSSINEEIGALRLEILQTAKVTKLDKALWSYANEPLALSVLARNLSTTFKFPKLSYNKTFKPSWLEPRKFLRFHIISSPPRKLSQLYEMVHHFTKRDHMDIDQAKFATSKTPVTNSTRYLSLPHCYQSLKGLTPCSNEIGILGNPPRLPPNPRHDELPFHCWYN
ncbi:hypothetical protein Goarm_003785, partial [Gossypium armourianum]|nr:hypothetical protein [Gossypium armourianum]